MNILTERIKDIEYMSNDEKLRTIHEYLRDIYDQLNHFSSVKHLSDVYEQLQDMDKRIKQLEDN